jgi:hypothetical protein
MKHIVLSIDNKKGTQMKHWIIGFGLIAITALPACVTINIYFPAAAAEKAADKIIDEVWQLNEKQSGAKTPSDTTSTPPAQ